MMKIAVLFDIDGVLNYVHSSDLIDDVNMENFSKICNLGECTLVLASKWKVIFQNRKKASRAKKKMVRLLERKLSDYGFTIQDMTPNIMGNRPLECKKWLCEHKEEYDVFFILDDDFSRKDYERAGIHTGLIQSKFFVPYNAVGGLQKEHVELAKQCIKRQIKMPKKTE